MTRAETAADRAEQIRLGLQSTGVLYAKAVEEEDWKALAYESQAAWIVGEFSADRYSPEIRKNIVNVLTATGMTQREIAAATGAAQSTIVNDQRKARDQDRSQESDTSDNTDIGSLDAAGWTQDPPLDNTSTESLDSARQRAAREREATRAAAREATRAHNREAMQRAAEAEREREAAAAAAAEEAAHTEEEAADVQNRKSWYSDADIEEIIARELGREQIMAQFKVNDHAAQLARKFADGIIRGRGETQVPSGRPKNWDGKSNDKRQRELTASRKAALADGSAYLKLIDVQRRLNQLTQVLEDIHIEDYGHEDTDVWAVADMYDDLVSLGEWHTRQVTAVQNYLGESRVVQRIEKLRRAEGRTPEETATASRLADKLEQAMRTRRAEGIIMS